MTFADIKRAKNLTPFRPFWLNLADGRAFIVSHPDAVSWGDKEAPTTLICWTPGDGVEWIDVELITSITIPGKTVKPEAN
jgi:hypothetical protein